MSYYNVSLRSAEKEIKKKKKKRNLPPAHVTNYAYYLVLFASIRFYDFKFDPYHVMIIYRYWDVSNFFSQNITFDIYPRATRSADRTCVHSQWYYNNK